MYVLIANGYKGIVESKEELDVLTSIYPYPKFRKVVNEEAAYKFLERYNRGEINPKYSNYGNTDRDNGYCILKYIIDGTDLFATLDTSHIGFIRLKSRRYSDIVVDNRPSMIRIRVFNINLNADLISDNCVAITTLLDIIGDYVDVNIVVPDISVYLALTKYSGKMYAIKICQDNISSRLGGVSFTVQ